MKFGNSSAVSLQSHMAPVEEGTYYTAKAILFNESGASRVHLEFWDDAKIVKAPKVLDLSGNGNHGIIVGGSELVKGLRGSALKFDGIYDHVEIPMDSSMKSLNAITIEAWVFSTPPHQSGLGR